MNYYKKKKIPTCLTIIFVFWVLSIYCLLKKIIIMNTREKNLTQNVTNLKNSRDLLAELNFSSKDKILEEYFEENRCKRIGVYGWGKVGQCLYKELVEIGIKPCVVVDKNYISLNNAEIEIVSPDSQLPEIDILIVSAVNCFDEIQQYMKKKVDCKIISLEDILYGIIR